MLMETRRGSIEAIKEIVRLGNKISVDEMAKISDMALALDGSIISLDPDEDRCGTGRIHIKWPPKRDEEFMKLLHHLVARRINYEILINGIPAPDHIIINVSRQIGQRLGR